MSSSQNITVLLLSVLPYVNCCLFLQCYRSRVVYKILSFCGVAKKKGSGAACTFYK
jgi:hypothetical protein